MDFQIYLRFLTNHILRLWISPSLLLFSTVTYLLYWYCFVSLALYLTLEVFEIHLLHCTYIYDSSKMASFKCSFIPIGE